MAVTTDLAPMRTLPHVLAAASCTLLCFGVSPTALAQPAPPPPAEPRPRPTDITLEEIWRDYELFADGVPGFDFRASGNAYSRIDEAQVVEVDFATGLPTATLFDYAAARAATGDTTLPEAFDGYAFSTDQRGLLIATGTEPIFRRSSRADYYLFDEPAGVLRALDTAGKQSYATFSPDGQRVAYVRERDLYVRDVATGETTRLTDDGAPGTIINGATDWVYEEEFAIAKGFAWSPDGTEILYLRFDETAVPEFTMEMYRDELYPEYRTWKYPKVGQANATVSVHVAELPSGKTRELFDTGDGDTHVPRIYWTPDGRPVAWTTNRHQDTFRLLVEPTPGAPLETLLTEASETYLDVHDDLTFLDDGSFLWTSDRSGFTHLYHLGRDGEPIRQLTEGNYPVTEFYGYDPAREVVYFQAAMRDPTRREVYRLPLAGGQPEEVSTEPGWNEAQFNADYSGYMLAHSTINRPPSYAVYDAATGELTRGLVDNAELRERQEAEGVQPLEFFAFDNGAGTELNGWMVLPEGVDATGADEYPLFMFVYGGPGSQEVVDQWFGPNYWWFQLLAQEGYVVACVDGRGTGARGAEFQKQTYLELGKLELADQVAAAKYLGGLPYVDAERIGIFGWSYGGYLTSLAATKASDVFSLAIAVAPVTNWKWYDTLYTERYMRTLAENADGYHDNSPVNFADGLEADYLIVHGTGDDNVHFQHTVEMVDALVAANKDFELFAYPNRNHGIYGGVTRYHLYERMTEFVREHL